MLPAAAYAPESWRDPLVDLEFRLRATLAARVYALAQHVPPLSAPVPSRRRNVPAADFMLSLGLFHTPLMYEVSVMHDDFEEVLAGFDALVRRSGSRLLVVLFPLRFQVSERDWRLLVRSTGLDPERFDLAAPNRRIREFCAEQGIACLDLLPAFRAAERSGRGPLYRPRGDMHFNDAGQALAAEAIADHLGGAAAR